MRRLVVHPDSDHLEEALVAASAREPIVDASGHCTFSQLVERCEPMQHARRAPASPLLVRALLGRHAPALASEAFGRTARTAEFAASLQELWGHLRSQGAPVDALRAAAQRVPPALAARAQGVAAVLAAAEADLTRLGLADAPSMLELAARRLDLGLPPRLQGLEAIELRAVHDLSPARLRFLEALAKACTRAGATFSLCWPAAGEAHADVFVGHALRTIEGRWGDLSAELLADTPETPLAWVGGQAFADEARAQPAPSLAAFSAATPGAEVHELARRVKRLVTQGTPPEQVAIALRDLGPDTEALVEALENLGVPSRARLGVPLAESPVGRLALSLFELVEDEFPAEQVAALLQSRYTREVWTGAPELLRWLKQAGVRDDRLGAESGRGAWSVRLEALSTRLAALGRESDAGEVRELRLAAEKVVALGQAIPAQGPATELLEAWWRSVSALGLDRALRRREPQAAGLLGRVVDRALARDQASAEALEGLVQALRDALEKSQLGRAQLTRRELWRWVRRAAADVNLTARGARTGAVWLLDARETVGRRFEHLFLGGLVDGRFPGRPLPLAVFSEEERGQLNTAAGRPLFALGVADGDVHLPARLAEDRLLLHAALSAATGTATLSYARSDEGGRELNPSPFLDAVGRVVQGFRVEAVARTVSRHLEDCASEAELRERLALEASCPPETRQSARDPRGPVVPLAVPEPWLEEATALAAAETQRLRFFSDEAAPAGPFTGLADAADLSPRLAELLHFPKERPTSASALGTWGNCAFRGMLEHLLRLREEDEQGEEIDTRVRGSFWHAALREAVPQLAKEGLLGNDAAAERVRPIVERAVATAAAEIGSEKGTGHPVLWRLAGERAVESLGGFVTSDAVLPFDGARPQHVELAFGGPDAPEALRAVAVKAALPGEEDVYVRGKIDRVDLGAGEGGVIDYKSKAGSKPERLNAALASEFQLPVYLRVLHQLAPEAALHGAWLGMHDGSACDFEEAVGPVKELLAEDRTTRARLADEQQLNLANAVHGLLGTLRRGDFKPRAQSCEHCHFSSVCRISARKLSDEGGED